MSYSVTKKTCLASLIEMAIPVCQQAEADYPRTGPGRRPEIADWVMAVLIMIVVAKRRKSKSSQYRFLWEYRRPLMKQLGISRLPSRTTYFDRYRRAHRLFQHALLVHSQKLARRGQIDVRCLAVDKSLIDSQGAFWHRQQRERGEIPPGVDRDATWTYSEHHGWVQGYGYEVVVTAEKKGDVWPLMGSLEPANWRENRTFPDKIRCLPKETRYVLADAGYDSNFHGDEIERDACGRKTGCRFLCPLQDRHNVGTAKKQWRETRKRKLARERREMRRTYMKTKQGQRLYARRAKTVEPFNAWFKSLFELDDHAWHYGLDNNQTQVLAALFVYQLLMRYNRRRKRFHSQIRWILDIL